MREDVEGERGRGGREGERERDEDDQSARKKQINTPRCSKRRRSNDHISAILVEIVSSQSTQE